MSEDHKIDRKEDPTYCPEDSDSFVAVSPGNVRHVNISGGPERFRDIRGFLVDHCADLGISEEEHKLFQAVDCSGIDIFSPENLWHLMVLISLVFRKAKYSYDEQDNLIISAAGTPSLFSKVISSMSKKHGKLDYVEYKSLTLEDLGQDIGTNRNVDLITLVFENGDALKFTASIDRRSSPMDWQDYQMKSYRLKEFLGADPDSPTSRESEALKTLNKARVSSVQKLFGARPIAFNWGNRKDETVSNWEKLGKSPGNFGTKFINLKEFIEGQMLYAYVVAPDLAVELVGRDIMKEIAYKTGRAVGEVIEKTGQIVCDSDPLNLIVGEKDGAINVRYCDVAGLSADAGEKDFEIRCLRRSFGFLAADFMKGVEGSKGGRV